MIWSGKGGIDVGVLMGGNATGAFAVGAEATVQESQLSGSPAQRMDQQSFARMEGDELVD